MTHDTARELNFSLSKILLCITGVEEALLNGDLLFCNKTI